MKSLRASARSAVALILTASLGFGSFAVAQETLPEVMRGALTSTNQILERQAAGFGLELNRDNTVFLGRADGTVALTSTAGELSEASLFGFFGFPFETSDGQQLPEGSYEIRFVGEERVPGLDVNVPTSAAIINEQGERVAEADVDVQFFIAPEGDEHEHGGIEAGLNVQAVSPAVPLRAIVIQASKCYRVKNGWVIVKVIVVCGC